MWQPIETAPTDGTRFLFYQEFAGGLNMIGLAAFKNGKFCSVKGGREDAGLTLVSPAYWSSIPKTQDA